MFKEIVSLAIITGFILNIIFVDHPNTASYTLYFVVSLAAFTPFILGWRWWFSRAAARDGIVDMRDVSTVGDLEAGRSAVSQSEEGEDGVDKGLLEEEGDEHEG